MEKTPSLKERIQKARQKQSKAQVSNASFQGVIKLGSELIAPVILCVLLGRFLDQKFGCQPLFIILFFILGSASGFYTVYRQVKTKNL